jgi:hypothetical protein
MISLPLLHVVSLTNDFSPLLSRSVILHSSSDVYRADYTTRAAMDASAPNISIVESTFTSINTTDDGGAVFCVFPGSLVVSQTLFGDVVTSARGGALFFHGNSLSIDFSCFSKMTARQGFAIFSARSVQGTVLRSNSYYNVNGTSFALWLYGLTIEMSSNNITDARASDGTAALQADAVRRFQCLSQTLRQNAGDVIVLLANVIPKFDIDGANYIVNKAEKTHISVLSYDAVLTNWNFVANSAAPIVAQGNSTVPISVTFRDCVFDKAAAMLAFPTWVTSENVRYGAAEERSIEVVASQQCWAQKRYTFKEPMLWKKVIIGITFGALFVLMIAYVVYENCQDRTRMKELEAENETNQALNAGFGGTDQGQDAVNALNQGMAPKRNRRVRGRT